MAYEDLLLEKNNGIATLTLNAPEKMNAITANMRKNLPLVAEEIARDTSIRVVILTGAGRAFCAGGDIEFMKARVEGTLKQTRCERLKLIGYWGDVLPKLDKPVIAAINGACMGAGFGLALSCDIRIASETAKFGSVFILRGLVPDSGTSYYLPRVVGLSKALEMMLTGEVINAAEAKSLGILSRVVPPEELMKSANEVAARIAQQSPIAVELTKRIVYRSALPDIANHIDWESYAQNICFGTKDHLESVRAFLEKRPQPPFTGE